MQLTQASQITRIVELDPIRDVGAFTRLVERYLHQFPGRVQVKLFSDHTLTTFDNLGIDQKTPNWDTVFSQCASGKEGALQAEIILQGIENIADSKEPGDELALAEPVLISGTTQKHHPLQIRPMFFRSIGNPIDLVDMYHDAAVFVMMESLWRSGKLREAASLCRDAARNRYTGTYPLLDMTCRKIEAYVASMRSEAVN